VIHFVIGTRAQLLKMAPVMLECEKRRLKWRWVYTAQHRDKIQETIETFGLRKPDYVVVKWETEAKSMATMWRWFLRMIFSLPRSRQIFAGCTGTRHIVLTHGDTLTTWLAALMAKVTLTPIMHVESGLRSFNMRNPFPEELNRLLTFRLVGYYACPGEWALSNVAKYKGFKLNTKMNTQVDTLRFGLARVGEANIELPRAKYVVVSLHRYENIFNRNRFERIIEELELIASKFTVLLIQHPATQLQIDRLGFRSRLEKNDRISLLPRLDYLAFIKAVVQSEFVVTDGGGNQEELSYLGKPTLILRNESERREGLGENAVLSKLGAGTISDFVADYKSFERPQQIPTDSPSRTIVDFLDERAFGR